MVYLFLHRLDVGGRKVYLVDHRDDDKVVLHGRVQVGEGLGLDPLGGIDEKEDPFARGEGPGNFVRKVNVAGRVDEVQLEFLTMCARIGQAYGLAFDRDAPLPLYVHVVEDLIPELAVIHEVGVLDEPIGEGRFPVVDVGDNAEVSYLLHGSSYSDDYPT